MCLLQIIATYETCKSATEFMNAFLYITKRLQNCYNRHKLTWGEGMGGFVIRKDEDKISSVNRTIRFKPELFEQISQESDRTGVSFNKIVNQCIEYAFSNLMQSDGEN